MSAAVEHAHAAAEAARGLCHSTIWLNSGAYEWPSDVDAVVGEIGSTVERLRQALDYAEQWLTQEQAAGRVGHDDRKDAAVTVELAAMALTSARVELGRAVHSLQVAQSSTSH